MTRHLPDPPDAIRFGLLGLAALVGFGAVCLIPAWPEPTIEPEPELVTSTSNTED